MGLALLAANSDDDDDDATTSTTSLFGTSTTGRFTTTTRSTATTGGPTTSVAGTGEAATVTASSITRFLREEQLKTTPDVTVGAISCPPGPYRVGHVVLCRMRLEDADVLYRVEITGTTAYNAKAARPIIDTDKAEALVEQNELDATADCGSPRIRQVDIGYEFTCTTATSTWDFTVKDEGGRIEGSRS